MDQIRIVKHLTPIPINDVGNILYPFETWETSLTGGGWYSKFEPELCSEMDFLPLHFIDQNPWNALLALSIQCFDFKEMVQYRCPYTGYEHYWSLPLYLFSNNISFWTQIIKTSDFKAEKVTDKEWMKKHHFPFSERGLKFNKIQRTLLGSGYTKIISHNDGDGYLYDTLLRLENNDILAGKVWIWFNKK